MTQIAGEANPRVNALVRRANEIVSVKDFGAKGDGVTDDTTAIQAAIDAAGSASGGIVFFPPGFYKTTSALTVTAGIIVQGSGLGAAGASPDGTVIRNGAAAGDVFDVQYSDSVQFRDFRIDCPSFTKASGTAGIRLAGTGGSGNTSRNCRITNVFIVNMYDGVLTEATQKLVANGLHVIDYLNIGLYLKQTGGTDSGGNSVTDCTFWDLNVGTSKEGIRYDKGGALSIMGTKFQGSDYNFRMELDAGDTGTLLFSNNSFEEAQISAIKLGRDSVATSNRFGNVAIVGNEFSTITDPVGMGNMVQIDEEGGTTNPDWIKNVNITENVFNMVITSGVSAIDIGNAEGGLVAHNVINGNDQA
ncbi:MAG: hypothetical protein J3T61_12795, partial [Candidatus Brocadiales bacterium]|nr:hypothetical protein [Candidatus Bathyanammoxibius sp.]